MITDISNTFALILCGGQGTRLRGVISDVPKPMAPVGGTPFLNLLIEYINSSGIRNIVLCTGYMSENIHKYYCENPRPGCTIYFSKEESPLGTGGALRHAEGLIQSDTFFVFNGDSISEIDLQGMLLFHNKTRASITIALNKSEHKMEYGNVQIDENCRITIFTEKCNTSAGFINAGIYVFSKDTLSSIPRDVNFSLERELFPAVKNAYGYVTDNLLIDIGTRERYHMANQIFKKRESK